MLIDVKAEEKILLEEEKEGRKKMKKERGAEKET
jgi:hypothetical protein